MFDLIVKAYLVISMMFFIPNNMAYGPQEMFIQYATMLLLGLSFLVKPKREISSKWLGIFLIYALCNTVFFNWDISSRKILLNLFLGVVTIKVLAERVSLKAEDYSTAFLFFVMLNYMFVCFQYYKVDPIHSSANPQNMTDIDYVGLMGIRYALGAVGCFALPFVYKRNALLPVLLMPLIYLGKSSSVALAFVVAYSFLLFHNHRRAFWLSMLILLVGCVWYVFLHDSPSGQFEKRIYVWLAGISVWKDQLWFGHGLGAWADFKFTTQQPNGNFELWKWAHNEYLQTALELGIVGVGILMMYFNRFIKRLDVRDDDFVFALLIILGILSALHFPFHVGRFAGVTMLIIAIAEGTVSERGHAHAY